MAIGIGNLIGVKRIIQAFQLVAGGQDCHTRLTIHRNVAAFDHRQHTNHAGRNLRACRQHNSAIAHALGPLPDVVTGFYRTQDFRLIIGKRFGIFDPDHGVRTLRHRCTGHDARALASRQGLGRHLARPDIFDNFQRSRAVRQIRTSQRETVHRRNIVRWLIAIRQNIRRQHASQTALNADRFNSQRLNGFQYARLRVRHG